LRRHGDVQIILADEAQASFTGVWDRLEPEGRLVLAAAAFFNPDRIRADQLRSHLAEAANCSAAIVDGALDACMDLSLLDPGEAELRMHRLLRDFVCRAEGLDRSQLALYRDALAADLVAAATAASDDPAASVRVADLLCYSRAPDRWSITGHPLTLSGTDYHSIGHGLTTIGLFEEARPWYERAVAQKEQGDVHGRVDHESLGASLHLIGDGLSQTGDYAGARPWYERAVAQAEQGDVHGRVDHQSLEISRQSLSFLDNKNSG
jgi:tetratricopeptide (TPR) repeat protein